MRRHRAPVPQTEVRRLRKGRPRRRARAKVLADSTICWLCGHDGATTVDEVVPLSYGGSALDPDNLRPAHGVQGCPTCGRKCNQARGNRAPRHPLPTSQRW
jgi:5-methylcytosine-specific restriction endonuclease McrA